MFNSENANNREYKFGTNSKAFYTVLEVPDIVKKTAGTNNMVDFYTVANNLVNFKLNVPITKQKMQAATIFSGNTIEVMPQIKNLDLKSFDKSNINSAQFTTQSTQMTGMVGRSEVIKVISSNTRITFDPNNFDLSLEKYFAKKIYEQYGNKSSDRYLRSKNDWEKRMAIGTEVAKVIELEKLLEGVSQEYLHRRLSEMRINQKSGLQKLAKQPMLTSKNANIIENPTTLVEFQGALSMLRAESQKAGNNFELLNSTPYVAIVGKDVAIPVEANTYQRLLTAAIPYAIVDWGESTEITDSAGNKLPANQTIVVLPIGFVEFYFGFGYTVTDTVSEGGFTMDVILLDPDTTTIFANNDPTLISRVAIVKLFPEKATSN